MRQSLLPFYDHSLAVFVERVARWLRACVHWGLALVFGVLLSLPAYGEENAPAAVSFTRDVQPIFARNCLGCHQEARPLGDYVMTSFAAMLLGGETGEAAIVAGDPDASYLMSQITPVDDYAEMPKKAKPLAAKDIETIRRWISEGAVDDSPEEVGPVYTGQNPPVYSRPPSITSIDALAANGLLAVAGFHEVLLVNQSDGQLVGRLVGLSERIESVKFSPDGTRLAAVGGQPGRTGEVQIWNVAEQALELSVFFTYDTLRGVSWSPDGSTVAFGATDNVVRAIDAKTGELKLFQGAHEDWVLGTAFTGKGDHVITVARDMTCKLTETATERFIDNITSITPGALKGGLSSVVSIPGRDEILVGGADGVAKVYQIFRTTDRKIGDDANLLRQMPAMQGRIFCVDVSDGATRLAAVSTIDGTSELRIWKARETAAFPEDVKAILGKQAGDRKPEEKKKLEEFLNPTEAELVKLAIPEAAAYACCFLSEQEVAVAGANGRVWVVNDKGEVNRTFEPAPVVQADAAMQVATYDPADWQQRRVSREQERDAELATEDQEQVAVASLVQRIEVVPSESVLLATPYEYVQLLVTGHLEDGSMVDVTRYASIEGSANLGVAEAGLVRPLANGDGKLVVKFGDYEQTVPVDVRMGASDSDVEINFKRDVNPVLSRVGCNQGTCHGAQKGKNGFILSLRGYDPIFDIRALTDDLAARRVNLASPDDSLMLLKALGRVPHEGGVLFDAGSPYHGIVRDWIAQGARLDLATRRVERISIQPENPVVQLAGAQQQVRVVAYFNDGSTRDVTREAFVDSGNTEVATSSPTGLLTAVRRGEAPLLARYEGNYAATTLTVMGQRDAFEWTEPTTYGSIDQLVAAKWERMKIRPSEVCDDATFLRRVYLDLTGLPPTVAEVRAFLADERAERVKRDEVVDRLIGSPAFVEYWTNKWADLLQVNRKFLGAEGAAKFREWIEQAVTENRPYDEFARQILTSTGSNKDNPAASYYKILRNPEDTMENTTHLFLGIRFNCNKCHDHPFERWTQDQYYETAAFFARTKLKADPASGDKRIGGTAVEGAKPLYEEVFDAKDGSIDHPRTGKPVQPDFPFACDFEEKENATERERLAAWMTSSSNPYFARSYVNRIWGYLLGVGLIEPIDDIRAGNPATNPELLDYLTDQFIESGFDARHIMRMICKTRVYQLSVATNEWNEDDRLNYSHALPRRLPAEVLYDTIHFVTGAMSHIPGVPAGTRAAELPDVGVATTDGFLANLGRPVRESACECERSSDLQLGPIMALVSGPTVGAAISDDKNDLGSMVARLEDDHALVEELFLKILNRPATEAELAAFVGALNSIDDDHQRLEQTLAEREAWWKETLPKLEAEQSTTVAASESELTELETMLKPERERLESERQQRVAVAEKTAADVEAGLVQRLDAWEQQRSSAADWYPLWPVELKATQGTEFKVLEDRSIRADGSKEKGTYEISFDTSLKNISGLRLEALPVEGIPGGGPGLPANGNFVVTEFEVFVAPKTSLDKQVPVKIAGGKASFSQSSFAIEQVFDGKTNDQGGWAISPAGATTHWATLKFAEPISVDGEVRLIVKLHQYHDAAEHRLARFRISATSRAGEIGLDLPESFIAALSVPKEKRSDEMQKPLLDFLAKTDATLMDVRQKLAEARRPVPEDEKVTVLKKRIAELKKPIPVDGKLLSLRVDIEQSKEQLKNLRLTAAEDLTWALVNSPAFLFNR
jgi:mono/diheme cytochrome c family protein